MTVGKVFLPAEIGEVLPETAAAEAGLQPGDIVTDIDGISIRNFNDMRGLVVESPGRQLTFTLVRDGNEMSLPVTPRSVFNEQMQINMGMLGVKSSGAGEREAVMARECACCSFFGCIPYVCDDPSWAYPPR